MKQITTENILRNYVRLADIMINYPDVKWRDVYSHGQIQSKLWLVEELEALNLDLGIVFLCGGWYASLANIMFMSQLQLDKIRSFDIDPSCADIAETLNRDYLIDKWKFKAITQDIHNIRYAGHSYQIQKDDGKKKTFCENPDTIINTSCEHIEDFNKWYDSIPESKLVVLQSNDFFELEEHINCVKNIEQFKEQCQMNNLLYSGTIELQKYNRFMLIGIK
jgi:hypothetical protein